MKSYTLTKLDDFNKASSLINTAQKALAGFWSNETEYGTPAEMSAAASIYRRQSSNEGLSLGAVATLANNVIQACDSHRKSAAKDLEAKKSEKNTENQRTHGKGCFTAQSVDKADKRAKLFLVGYNALKDVIAGKSVEVTEAKTLQNA